MWLNQKTNWNDRISNEDVLRIAKEKEKYWEKQSRGPRAVGTYFEAQVFVKLVIDGMIQDKCRKRERWICMLNEHRTNLQKEIKAAGWSSGSLMTVLGTKFVVHREREQEIALMYHLDVKSDERQWHFELHFCHSFKGAFYC